MRRRKAASQGGIALPTPSAFRSAPPGRRGTGGRWRLATWHLGGCRARRRSWPRSSPASARRRPGRRRCASDEPITAPPCTPPPANNTDLQRRPSGRGPASCRSPERCARSCGVRPNSPAMTTSVLSSRPLSSQVVEQRGHGPVGRRKEIVLQAGEVVAVQVPGSEVAHVDLHHVDARLDEPAGHQQRPAERIVAVALEDARIGLADVEGVAAPPGWSAATRPTGATRS